MSVRMLPATFNRGVVTQPFIGADRADPRAEPAEFLIGCTPGTSTIGCPAAAQFNR